jgi:hypothetical protein
VVFCDAVLVVEVLAVDREVGLHHGADSIEPGLLLGGERLALGHPLEGQGDALGRVEEGRLLVGRVLHHGDDVHEGLPVTHLVGLLEVLDGEALAGRGELLLQLVERRGAPVPRAIEEDPDRRDPVLVLDHEAGEGGQVVLGLESLAVGVPHHPRGGDRVLVLGRLEERAVGSGKAQQRLLKLLVAEELHRGGVVLAEGSRQVSGEAGEVTVGDVDRKGLPGLSGEGLVESLEPLDEAADVVGRVAVLPDLLDDLVERPHGATRQVLGDAGCLAEVLEERAVEAVEDREVGLVAVSLPLARAARSSAGAGCGTRGSAGAAGPPGP